MEEDGDLLDHSGWHMNVVGILIQYESPTCIPTLLCYA